MTIRLVVEETSWRFDDIPAPDCLEALEILLDRIDDAYAEGHDSCYSEDLFDVFVLGDRRFFDLCNEDSPLLIPADVRERIASIFGRLPRWQELSLPDSFDVFVETGAAEFAPSIAWAHAQSADEPGNGPACLVFEPARATGCYRVTVQNRTCDMWFVSSRQSYNNYFRALIERFSSSPAEMEALSHSAFPDLDFRAECFGGIKDMSKPYRELAKPLVHHLSALSDHGARVFSGPREQVAAEFGALGVDISNENGNTKSDREALNERTKVVNGADVVFLWHTKLERHCDRIHLSADGLSTGQRLLIGIFCQHLK
ncbi:hypothetical protein FCJ61_05980 [Burkholderia metallica]|uniref:hypothetical protein n=1 Tax=Burkholderia metallica TaxID=488729 RepID=UPI00157B794A|nr:hypothetical protein [Burkholderia metallica]NTZ82561.1 hypothetical protein [Burkholderia metallica]